MFTIYLISLVVAMLMWAYVGRTVWLESDEILVKHLIGFVLLSVFTTIVPIMNTAVSFILIVISVHHIADNEDTSYWFNKPIKN